MKKNEIEKKIRESLSEVSIPIQVDSIPNNGLLSDYGLDSILLMEFMMNVEEKFDIVFDEKLEIGTLSVIEKLVNYIYENYGNQIG